MGSQELNTTGRLTLPLFLKTKNFISVLYFPYQGCIFENLITLNLFCSIQFLSLLSGEITALQVTSNFLLCGTRLALEINLDVGQKEG